MVSLEGPSGSGKTTLLQLLGALDSPTGGTIRFEGRDLGGLNDRELTKIRAEEIGFVFQHFNLIPTLTAEENVAIAMFPNHVPAHERLERAKVLLNQVGLGPRFRSPAIAPLRRGAAARRDRPGTGQQPECHHRRRADRQPRLRHGQRGHVDTERVARERQCDDRDRDPRRGRRQADGPADSHPRRQDPRRLRRVTLEPAVRGAAAGLTATCRAHRVCRASWRRLTPSAWFDERRGSPGARERVRPGLVALPLADTPGGYSWRYGRDRAPGLQR